MKFLVYLLLVLSFSIFSFSCASETPKEAPTKSEVKEMALPAPLQDNQLSPKQLEDIKTIHATFTEVYPISLNETTQNFKKDVNPEREIAVWMKMVETFNALTSQGKYPAVEQREEVFSVILASTMMPLAKIKADVELNYLTDVEIEQISSAFMSNFASE